MINVNNLNNDDIFKFTDLYFNRYMVLYNHLYNSMNKFFDEDVRQFLENGEHTFFEKITKNKVIKYKFKYENISIKEPTLENNIEPMFPSDARNRNLTYTVKVLARVTQLQEIIDIATDEKKTIIVGQPEDNVPIANLPVMVRSKYCSLNLHKGYDKSECEHDPGGYFIVNGSEKVIICQDRMVENKPLIFLKKDTGTELYTAQVNSKSYKPHGITQILSIKVKKDGNLTIRVPILNEINVFVLFRALGIEPDKEIINYICPNDTDYEMIDKIRGGLSFSKTEKENMKILTQEQAIEFLSGKLRVLRKYAENDKTTKINQKKIHILTLLQNNFLPHIEGNLVTKAYYLGYVINKLLRAVLGRIPLDDRDSYINKRVDLPGDLLMELFRQFYKQMLNNCGNFFKKRTGGDDVPLNIINQIKPNTIEQGIKAALSTGAWPRRKGVAQMMQRLTYLQSISFLRRIDAPGGDSSASKLTSPRHLHPSSAALLCCVTGDSEILQSDKTVKRIDEMNTSDCVMSVHYKNGILSECHTQIKNYFSKIPNKLFEIKTITGKILKCTDDHPILVKRNNEYVMVNADKLQPNDSVITRYMTKYVPKDKDYVLNLDNYNLNDNFKSILTLSGYSSKIDNDKLHVIASLLGLSITTGEHIYDGSNYTTKFYVSEIKDGFEICNDINKLGLGHALIEKNTDDPKKPWIVSKSGVFSYLLQTIGTQWINDSNKQIKKEFLSGVYSWYNLDKQKIKPGYEYQISDLCNEFGILNQINNGEICIDKTYDNLEKYANIISHKYCHSMQNNIISAIEYNNYMINNKNKSDILSYKSFTEQYYIGELNHAIPIEYIKEIPIEPVYDFETVSESHSFVVNGIITSNCTQTPEHAKVGLTKHLALIASITILEQSQYSLIKNFLKKKITDLRDINPNKIYHMTKVFINGFWMGVTDNAVKLNNELRKHKEEGYFNPLVSIVWDINEKEIRIYCDGGRLYRPVFKVSDNTVKLTKEMLSKISLNKSDKTKGNITSWEEFIIEYPSVVEYIDMEEQPYLMICDKIEKLEDMRVHMEKSKEKSLEITTNESQDRYNDDYLYIKYSHCEFHPSLLLGEIVSNIPFCNHNAGPRNIFFYAQAKQGMSLYASNYRDRLDISYILYHPQKSLITTRASKYNNTNIMAGGENIVVAISTYTGFNQEDSIVFNLSSIERGLFRSTSLKKEFAQIQKNQSTSQDDIFMKPNPTKVAGMKHGSYDKLNDKGYVPEETVVVDGDIIIGKVSPIQPVGNSNKVFKDSSVVYKSYTPGVIDKVYTGIYNSEGHEIRKVRIRSERIPQIGDKFCSSYGQKGTIGMYLRQTDMPFSKHGITPDIILNPHCFVGETLVSLPNGLSKRIDKFSKQGLEKVMSLNKNIYDENDYIIDNNIGITHSYSLGMENKGIKDTIKIIMDDGKEIICTPDHKFPLKLDNKIIIKEAKDLTNDDLLLCSFDGTEDIIYDDEINYELKTEHFDFNMKNSHERERLLAFVRIVGYILADGYISKDKQDEKSYNIRMCMGCEIDVENILNDIKLITDIKQLQHKDNLYCIVQLNSTLAYSIAKLLKTTQKTHLPEFVLDDNCPKSIIREFVAGLFGSIGHAPYLRENDFSTVEFSQSICCDHEQSNIDKINIICKLLKKLNVDVEVCHQMNEIYKLKVDSNLQFLTNIGFRYCVQKSAKLTIACSYERLEKSVIKQHNDMIELINTNINLGQTIDNAIKHAKELYYHDKIPLNDYYSLTNNNMITNKINENRQLLLTKLNYKYFPTAYKYIEHIGCLNWFSKTIDNTQLSIFTKKIKGIVKYKPMEVYDIGVAKYHNFCANGIITRNCIPSRMTVGQILECVMGKSCAINGTEGDGTPFNGVDIDSVRNELTKLGYSNSGKECLYNGMTGQKLKTEIFIGPTYYLRLKHLVEDKFHSRARGPKTLLMHQPPEGRSREGGLRLGEMERDSLLAHGLSRFLKEKLMDTSDAYSTYICDICGLFAQRLFKKDNQSHASTNDLHFCASCKNYTKISKVMIPYAFKLVLQEMMAMNIAPRVRVEQDKI